MDHEDKMPDHYARSAQESQHRISVRSFLVSPDTTPSRTITRDYEERGKELDALASTFTSQAIEISASNSSEVDAEVKSIIKSRVSEIASYPPEDQHDLFTTIQDQYLLLYAEYQKLALVEPILLQFCSPTEKIDSSLLINLPNYLRSSARKFETISEI